jgi:hypothetical protein
MGIKETKLKAYSRRDIKNKKPIGEDKIVH